MSTDGPGSTPDNHAPAGDGTPPADQQNEGADGAQPADQEAAAEETDQPQRAWEARRDLRDHAPRSMRFDAESRFGGGVVAGDNHGLSAGRVVGDVFLGGKTEVHYQWGGAAAHSSGEIPRARVDALAERFVYDAEVFATLVERLRAERVLVLAGPHFAGRRTAALVLLHRLGVAPVRTLDRETGPGALADQVATGGQILCDPVGTPGRPLREADLLSVRERLTEKDAYLVVTVGPAAALEDIPVARWEQPAARAVLESHLGALASPGTVQKLLSLPAVAHFLRRGPQPREAVAYASVLMEYAAGLATEEDTERFPLAALETQVQEWFEADEATLHLRDKAFLVALAAFDGGPYALTAELSDLLYALLQKTENPGRYPTVPVFGTHIGKRLQLARAHRYPEQEQTEWGPVHQLKAAYLDDRAALVLLREVWTGHPSARPALIKWLRQLAADGRPLVRTRAASTVAVLALADLPSAMALIIEPWSTSQLFRHRLVAVNTLALAHLLGAPNVPRIIDSWGTDESKRLRWVAIRAHGLIGPERPVEALAALRGSARREFRQDEPDEQLLEELASSVELLLLSPAGDVVLAQLRASLHADRPEFDLAIGGFISACRRTEDDERYGMPLVLRWYAGAAHEGTGADQDLAALWRAALGDPAQTRAALDVLRHWALAADRDRATEWALAALLPALITTVPEHQRLAHLLRTMPGEDGTPPPPVTARLRAVLGQPAH